MTANMDVQPGHSTEKPTFHTGKPLRLIIRKVLETAITWIIYFVIAFVFLLPMVYVLGNSVRDSQQIWENAYPASWKTFIPYEGITLENFETALGIGAIAKGQGMQIGQNLWISFASSICVVGLSLIFNTSAAYFFARLRFPGKSLLLVFVIATMMIPRQVVMVPLYIVVDALGIINSFPALIVPWYASPLIIFLLIQFMSDLPYEYDEAAIIEGANYWQILWRIVIPNVIPGLLTISLIEFQYIWNEFYWPLIAINDSKLYPVQVAVASLFTETSPNWGIVFAAMVLASGPVILLFFFLQRFFYESVAMSGVKG
jgi:ABC-type glycerol-3-phosphate transport system permease component